MKVFELHLNPRNKEDEAIGTFTYEPASVYEKKLGSLYMSGELKKLLPQNVRLLQTVATTVHKEYYSAGLKKSPQQSLRDSLKKANELLDSEVQKGNVSFLGNLNFGILSFSNSVLNFTKIGRMKILLIRNNEVLDISQSLESPEAANHSLKVFGSIATGKLTQDDKVLVLNKEIFAALNKDKSFLKQLKGAANEKELKEVIKKKKQALAELSGACLFLLVDESSTAKQTLALKQEAPPFSFRKAFIKPIVKRLPTVKLPSFKMPSIKLPQTKKPEFNLPKLKIPEMKLAVPKISRPEFRIPRKKLVLFLFLILILAASFFLFRGERDIELQEAQQRMAQAETKVTMAESLLILEENEQAQTLFEEALILISPLTKRGSPVRERALFLRNTIEENLSDLTSAQR